MIEGRDFAVATTIGARDRQEDEWGIFPGPPSLEDGALLLAAVADGMGGMPAGSQASDITVRVFFDSYVLINRPAHERLRHALAHANREVGIAVEADPRLDGMGCTLVAALFFTDRCEWLSVGDSLILLYRDGELERVNPFHIFANELDARAERGEISRGEAQQHPNRSMLTSAVQGGPLEEVAQGEFRLRHGDLVLLASDGINTLSDDQVVEICSAKLGGGAEAIAESIVSRIDGRERAGQDNATVLAVRHDMSEVKTARMTVLEEAEISQSPVREA